MRINTTGPSQAIDWSGGYGAVLVQGDFGGSTVTAEAKYLEEDVWVPVQDLQGEPISITNGAAVNFLTAPCAIRVNATGGSPDVEFSLRRIFIPISQRY